MEELLLLEKELTFDTFTNEMALEFAGEVLRIIKEENLANIRIRVTLDDDIIFQYMMDGKKGDMWLNRKEVTVLESLHSSLYVFEHQQDYAYMVGNDKYAVCGGGFPLVINGEVRGTFIVSGLSHTEDHRLIVDALRRLKK